jgi:hypothetical protein
LGKTLRRAASVGSVLFLFIFIIFAFIFTRDNRQLGTIPRHSNPPVLLDPDPIELGDLEPGRSAEAKLSLRNRGSETVVLERIETSCPCVSVSPASLRLHPGGAAELRVHFDPTDEPEFRGGLSVTLVGWGRPGAILFRTHVNVAVMSGGRPAG